MNENLLMTMASVTESAAIAAYDWLGKGDKNKADEVAVKAMREKLNLAHIDGEIVIGEGEIDEAPMLYIGEHVGLGGEHIDIAVDPIEGTRMTAMGQSNAIAVLAAAPKGSFLKAPDMYMEKIVVGASAKGAINLSLSLEDNLHQVAKALNKQVRDLVVVTLDKPRHQDAIKKMHSLGIKVFAFPDGDVAASVLVCMPESEIDLMYCIGGAPEGVITAAVIKAFNGDMNAKLLTRDKVKGDSIENINHANEERIRCNEMKVKENTVLHLDELVRSEQVIFSATGITKGDLLQGIQKRKDNLITETLLIKGPNLKVCVLKSANSIY